MQIDWRRFHGELSRTPPSGDDERARQNVPYQRLVWQRISTGGRCVPGNVMLPPQPGTDGVVSDVLVNQPESLVLSESVGRYLANM